MPIPLQYPHVIDVVLPFLCSYLPTWWQQGPDNAAPSSSGSHMTMVTSEHLNHLFRLVLRLIMNNVGDDRAEWLTNIAVYAQQVLLLPFYGDPLSTIYFFLDYFGAL